MPTSAKAAALNVTVIDIHSAVYLTITPTGRTLTSDVNWTSPRETVSNSDLTTLSKNGTLVITNGSTMTVDVVIDLLDYFS